jgi:hypothetical protein
MAGRLTGDGSPYPHTEGAVTAGRGVPAEPSWRPIQISSSRFDGPSGETQAGQGFQSCKSWKILSKFIPPISPQNVSSHFPTGSGSLNLISSLETRPIRGADHCADGAWGRGFHPGLDIDGDYSGGSQDRVMDTRRPGSGQEGFGTCIGFSQKSRAGQGGRRHRVGRGGREGGLRQD